MYGTKFFERVDSYILSMLTYLGQSICTVDKERRDLINCKVSSLFLVMGQF